MGYTVFGSVQFGDTFPGDPSHDGNPTDDFSLTLSGTDVVLDPVLQGGTSTFDGAMLRAAMSALR